MEKYLRQSFLLLSTLTNLREPPKRFKRFLTGTVEVFRSLLWDLRGCGNTKFEKERQSFLWKNWLGLLFLILSNITKVMEQLIRVHKVFWQVVCKLYDPFFRTGEVENQIFQN